MEALRKEVRSLFVWSNVDALLVIAVAVVVIALNELVPNLNSRIVSSAILALLGVTAFVLLRDRKSRADLDDLRQLASDAQSDLPYAISWQENDWDLKDRHHSTVTKMQGLRFTRNDVSIISHWSAGDGDETRCEGKWRRSKNAPWIEAKKIYELGVDGGKKVFFSLGEEHARKDMLDWCIERDAVDRFADAHESVSYEAKTQTDFPRRLRIRWPPGEPPAQVELRIGDQSPRTLVPKIENERAFVDETVGVLLPGERLDITWTW